MTAPSSSFTSPVGRVSRPPWVKPEQWQWAMRQSTATNGGSSSGLGTFTTDDNPEVEIFRWLCGQELRFLSRILHGGGAGGALRDGRSDAASEDLCRVPVGCRVATWSWSMARAA